jgi:hypothetical protein
MFWPKSARLRFERIAGERDEACAVSVLRRRRPKPAAKRGAKQALRDEFELKQAKNAHAVECRRAGQTSGLPASVAAGDG